jgi:L-fucose isomerase-like protein
MNNHVAKQLDRPIFALAGPFSGERFQKEFGEFLAVAGTIRFLRRDFLARFGDAPGGFHSATGDQIKAAKVFGTRVDTIDLTAVWEAFKSGKAVGYLGEQTFTDQDVEATMADLRKGRICEVPDEMLVKSARLYHAFRALIRANGYTSASFRCWPEFNEPFLGVSTCLAMAQLLGNGDLSAAACEGDWPTAVMQTIGTLLSGKPAACLDWVNYTGGSDVIQLGHCGFGICGSMGCGKSPEAITVHPVLRQAGKSVGPVLTGQFAYGAKTGICLTTKPDGSYQLLSFEGESSQNTDQGMKYSAADIRVPEYKRLNEIVLEHGFPHHLAVAEGQHNSALKMLCTLLGVEHVSPQ